MSVQPVCLAESSELCFSGSGCLAVGFYIALKCTSAGQTFEWLRPSVLNVVVCNGYFYQSHSSPV